MAHKTPTNRVGARGAKGRVIRHPTRGRPSKLTPELIETVARAIRRGNYIETAAALAGIAKDTLYDWLRRGAAEESGIYRDFADAVEMALAEAEDADVRRIDEAAGQQWQAAAWRLERKFPGRWGRRDRVSLEGGDKPVQVEGVSERGTLEPTPEDLLEAARLVLAHVPAALAGVGGRDAGGAPRAGADAPVAAA